MSIWIGEFCCCLVLSSEKTQAEGNTAERYECSVWSSEYTRRERGCSRPGFKNITYVRSVAKAEAADDDEGSNPKTQL
jgi:hypothetical protein